LGKKRSPMTWSRCKNEREKWWGLLRFLAKEEMGMDEGTLPIPFASFINYWSHLVSSSHIDTLSTNENWGPTPNLLLGLWRF
jgi:hypothetical protein